MPSFTQRMRDAGDALNVQRSAFMVEKQLGLTDTYNLLHLPAVSDPAIGRLRRLHVELDEAVCEAYGWDDLISELTHAHYETRQGVRWTIAPAVQTEILDRLLELNHERYAAEVAAGLHDRAKKKLPRAPRQKPGMDEPTLFGGKA
jgi:hypothetical protein